MSKATVVPAAGHLPTEFGLGTAADSLSIGVKIEAVKATFPM